MQRSGLMAFIRTTKDYEVLVLVTRKRSAIKYLTAGFPLARAVAEMKLFGYSATHFMASVIMSTTRRS